MDPRESSGGARAFYPELAPEPTLEAEALAAEQLSASYVRPVPPRALVLSIGALSVSVIASALVPESIDEYGFLVWLLALVPAFLLCYYRGWHRIMLVLTVGMVLLTTGYLSGVTMGWELPEWPFFVFVIAAYIGMALGVGWFGEVRTAVLRKREAEERLRAAYSDLRKSHADLQVAHWQLIEAEKLEAVGRLAAGVAHEVKNPLMTLLTGVQYLSKYVAIDDENVRILLADMRDAVHRADAVIRGLLDFSAPGKLDSHPENLNTLVERSVRMVKHQLDRAQVACVQLLTPDLPSLLLDSQKLQQVLVNVLTNAAHATPAGGTITARTFVVPETLVSGAAGGQEAEHLGTGGNVVVLQVDDTGTGIPEDKLSKLFEPFFTTKPAGEGTGLGLAVSRQIVELHGGTIDIRNRDQGGARVTIAFRVQGGSLSDA